MGAYLSKNRFDQDIIEQLKEEKANMVIWDGMSDIVDRAFEGEEWESKPFPSQKFPEEVLKLLEHSIAPELAAGFQQRVISVT